MQHLSNDQYAACIDACQACATACDTCFSLCLKEPDVRMMADCMACDVDCAQACRFAAAAMARGSPFAPAICDLCAQICRACEQACATHHVAHCQACARACGMCATACEDMSQ